MDFYLSYAIAKNINAEIFIELFVCIDKNIM